MASKDEPPSLDDQVIAALVAQMRNGQFIVTKARRLWR
jgi:hypothetical protein